MKEKNPFTILHGEQLSSVIFVLDYLQLEFDGNVLTCYKWPILHIKGVEYSFEHREYRNQLCSLITIKVSETNLIDTVRLEIRFISGPILAMNLNYDDPDLKEIATFRDSNERWSFY